MRPSVAPASASTAWAACCGRYPSPTSACSSCSAMPAARRTPAGRGGERQRRELVPQLHHEPLGGLLADAGDLGEPGHVARGHRGGEVARLDAGEDVLGRARTDVLHADELAEHRLLLLGGEAEEVERVLPDVHVAAQPDPLPGRQRRQAGGRDVEQVADAVHVEHHRPVALLDDGSLDVGDQATPRVRRGRGAAHAARGSARRGAGRPGRCGTPRARWRRPRRRGAR